MSSARDLQTLADYSVALNIRELDTDVVSVSKACLLYGLAVGVGARKASAVKMALSATTKSDSGSNTATCFADAEYAAVGDAAFINAVMMAARVQGDAHSCGHIGSVVLSAALALAEQRQVSGGRLMEAIIVGYEVALRIGRDHGADLSLRGFRTTPCYGVFGAAAAAGKILQFTASQMSSSIALAANFAGGLREFVDAGTEESPYQSGFASRNGLYVGNLAKVNVVAAPSSLHGKAGFFNAYGAAGVDYGARLAEKLGTDFEFTNVTFREYPANQFFRGIIRGMAMLGDKAGHVEPKSIELRMHPFEADFIGARYAGPFTSATQTVVSAPFCASLAWVTGNATFDALRNFNDERILKLVPKVVLIADKSCARYEPRLKVELNNGETLTWAEEAGASNYRLTWDTAIKMTYQLYEEVGVPRALAQRLIDQVADIERLAEIAPLVSAVCAAAKAD